MNTISLSKIKLEAPTQLRALGEDMTHVKDLAYSFADTGTFNELPWVGYVEETKEYVPIDGFHRLNAIDWLTKQNEIQVQVDVENVAIRYSEFTTMADAIVAAAGVNANHGLKRKSSDIHSTIRKLLEVDRMRFLKDKYTLDKKEIMSVVKCSSATYKRATEEVRGELTRSRDFRITTLSDEGLTQAEIAKRIGCGQTTVSGILKRKSSVSLSAKPVNEQQEGISRETPATPDDTDTTEEQSSVFAHITEASVAECPWDDVEEDVEVQEEATGPSFSETHSQARIRLFIEDLSEEDKAYALKLLAM
ncbi:hypothetical protein RJ44_11710 [Alteromonas macleodii]|uniref:hypothetical protein n=1 Tax=Alteromonas macleodii TaxID=28108 RepID=UPI00057F31E7|nr:hypothetical protein [Alteromonas macleodii]KHT58985.1 hypothetical protein RJ44_11710 [Alteromonas macleodii]